MADNKPAEKRLHKLDLSKTLGCSRPTLDKYLNLPDAPKPDADGGYDVMQVVDYIRKKSKQALDSDETVDWRAKKLELECARLIVDVDAREHALAIERGEYISKTEASNILAPLMTELVTMLRQKFEMELPSQYTGKTLIEREQLNASAVDFIIERMKNGTERLREDS